MPTSRARGRRQEAPDPLDDVATVCVHYRGGVCDVVLAPGLAVDELQACLRAGFAALAIASSSGAATKPVALVRKGKDPVVYPLSLVCRSPQLFENATYELIMDGEVSTTVNGTADLALRNGKHGHRRRRHHRRHGHQHHQIGHSYEGDAELLELSSEEEKEEEDEGEDAILESHEGDDDEDEEDEGSMQDVDQLLCEIDLSDFALPHVVHVFMRACPTRKLDRATFTRCLEKLLKQTSRYDPRAPKMFVHLFEIFDRERHDGVVDVTSFLGGVSVFASGERDEKIAHTFALYDADNDGYISMAEMTKYLTSVFLVIAETSPEVFQQHTVNPIELGLITARQCFSESPLNQEGKLSYAAFQTWYSKPGPVQFANITGAATNGTTPRGNDSGSELSLVHLRELTGLSALTAEDMFSMFRAATGSKQGKRDADVLTRDEFKRAFYSILKKQNHKPTREMARFLDRLFNAFDADGNDAVDFVKLSSGLSILCGGTQDDKVKAAFSLFDTNEDGFISPQEMETYLTSVFNVMYETTKNSIPIEPKQLARFTTMQAFSDADLNHDGSLSFDEFRKWYLAGAPNVPALSAQASMLATNNDASATGVFSSTAQNTLASIEFVASLTSLRTRQATDVFEILAAQVNEEGVLSREAFHAVFKELVIDSEGQTKQKLTKQQSTKLREILDSMFDEFDGDQDGYVDFCELCSGLSILCSGSQHEKIKAAFVLFDINQDGFISREEMETYLASVFRVIFISSPATAKQMQQVSPEQLAKATTAEAFNSSDVNRDGRLSFQEFTKWYMAQDPLGFRGANASGINGSTPVRTSVLPKSSKETLIEMKKLTNLISYDVNDIFEYFQSAADEDGNLNKETFLRCFSKLLATDSKADKETQTKRRTLLKELFELFDTDGNGTIDVQELGGGLSVLCGGSVKDRAQSLFTLYDINHDGFISPSEMESYLTTVFKVIYKASPEMQSQTEMTPEELAIATTKECFRLYDDNGDQQLSLDEFTEWVSRNKSQAKSGASIQPKHQPTTLPLPNGTNSAKTKSTSTAAAVIPVSVAKKLSGLKNIALERVTQLFSSAMDKQGQISRQAFDACFYKYLCATISTEMTAEESMRVHEVIDRLFTAFDTDRNGFVDYNELSSGLSILCDGSSRDAKVQAAFDLYDTNGDGVISEDEMVHYLNSVFKLLYALDPTREQNLGASAETLARVTASEIFAEADLNHDGKLNFEEFQKWYSQPAQSSFNDIVAPIDLNEVRQLTNLGNMDVVDVFERFAEYADGEGLLERESFDKCFFDIIDMASHPRTEVEKLRAKVVADRLFDVFDSDGNGKIDFSELASGLSVLCKGARDAKVKAAFRLYDFNGDGFISLEEMTRYLTSIFKVLYEIQPEMQNEAGVSAEELGVVTAEQAFLEADINRDGKLSYDEFLNWYNSPSQAGISSVVAKNAIVDSSLRWMPLSEIKRLTNLAQYEPDEVFEVFAAEADENGLLSRAAFNESFRKIINGLDIEDDSADVFDALSEEAKQKIKEVINGLFTLFDTDNSGSVDFGELASGLSVLCGGTKDQKVQAAFSLFDFNGDGFISMDEMTRYLTSVFRVLFQVSPDTQSLGVSPDELGLVTAQQAFAEADKDHDGRLTLEEFQKWYQQPGGIGEVAKNGEQLFSLAEARRLTNLESISAMDVFEALADCADEQGFVSREAFDDCFRNLIAANHGIKSENYEHINAILNRLFEIFDVDKNGLVDFSEISSGLSVFCGGTSDDKIRAAFALYDYNADGYISMDEMARYLTSVFKVLKEASPDAFSHLQGESPEVLGLRAATRAFQEADLDHDGMLSLAEFGKWYTTSSVANVERLMENNIPEWLSLRDVRRLTNLHSHSVNDVMEHFSGFTSADGTLSKEAFREAFDQLKAEENDDAANDRLRLMVDRIFALFDTDHNGTVDFNELASGLSVLSGGSETDKIRAAFNLYDVNHDGYISMGEMRLYLTSVFKVLFDVNPESKSRVGVTPEELAEITATQAFIEADADKDGKLSFEEFSQWYQQPLSEQNQSHVPEWVSLQVVKEMTHLQKYSPDEVFAIFANRCSDEGTISREAFEECFEQLIDEQFKSNGEQIVRVRLILDRLFTIFDTDSNGVVDFCELSSGLSVLCGGTHEDKVRAAFALYDLNEDGVISLEEMTRYLTSVFKVLYETNSDTRTRLGVTPEELASVTAEQCFAEADLNHDGCLTFEEFLRWYSESNGSEIPGVNLLESQELGRTQEISNGHPGTGNSEHLQNGTDDKTSPLTASLNMNSSSMDRVRHLLKLDSYEVNDLFEIFAEAAPSGELSFASFKKCFDQIVKLAGGHSSVEEREEADEMIRRMFSAFDTDKSNTVDFGELASGLSVLSGSNMDDKVRAAFQLYDINGDGFITLDEMVSYMTSIFKVMYETSDSTKTKMGVPPEELARVTATQCFKDADLNNDNKLSFEEFKKAWVACCQERDRDRKSDERIPAHQFSYGENNATTDKAISKNLCTFKLKAFDKAYLLVPLCCNIANCHFLLKRTQGTMEPTRLSGSKRQFQEIISDANTFKAGIPHLIAMLGGPGEDRVAAASALTHIGRRNAANSTEIINRGGFFALVKLFKGASDQQRTATEALAALTGSNHDYTQPTPLLVALMGSGDDAERNFVLGWNRCVYFNAERH